MKRIAFCCFLILLVSCKVLQNTPKSSAINVLSSRFFHPRNSQDSASTLEAIQKLNPKRIDWTYFENEDFLKIYKKNNIPFSLSINPQVSDSSGYTTKKYRIIDFLDNPYSAPWMKNWKIKNPYWGCVNNPKFYSLFLKKGLQFASLGAYAIQVDDALFNYRLVIEKKIGCFCKYCELIFNKTQQKTSKNTITYFKEILINGQFKTKENINWSLVRSYEEFQKQSVIDFLSRWMIEIRNEYPSILFFTNNYNGNWNEIYQVFDGGIAELKVKHINDRDLDSLYFLADSLGKSQLFTVATENKKIHYKLLEYNIKNKREYLYPWDIMISEKNKRFYLPLDSIVHKENEYLTKYK